MKGESNHRLLSRATRCGPALTDSGYELYDLGAYPALVAGSRSLVHGEIYQVDTATLARVDALEGHPGYYRRQPLMLRDGRRVETYILPREEARGCPRIRSGDWRQHRRMTAQAATALA